MWINSQSSSVIFVLIVMQKETKCSTDVWSFKPLTELHSNIALLSEVASAQKPLPGTYKHKLTRCHIFIISVAHQWDRNDFYFALHLLMGLQVPATSILLLRTAAVATENGEWGRGGWGCGGKETVTECWRRKETEIEKKEKIGEDEIWVWDRRRSGTQKELQIDCCFVYLWCFQCLLASFYSTFWLNLNHDSYLIILISETSLHSW